MRLSLSACPPFSLWAVVESHGWARLPPFAADPSVGVLTRVERLESARVVELVIRETVEGVAVAVRDPLTGPEREEIARKVWWMLGLGENLSPFYALVRQEPRLAHVERRALGRMLRSPTVFEDLVKTLLTTNITWAGTTRMVMALVSHYGDPLPTDPSRNAFPTPTQLAAASVEDLRACGLGYRAPLVADIARRVAAGELPLEELKDGHRSSAEVCAILRQVQGIGEYGASLLALLTGHYDCLPVDTWALKLVSREWYAGQSVDRRAVEAAFEKWAPWQGLAYWFWDWTAQKGES